MHPSYRPAGVPKSTQRSILRNQHYINSSILVTVSIQSRITGTTKETNSQESAGKKVIKWYGSVMRRNEEYVGKRVIRMYVEKRKTEAGVDG